MVCRRQRGAWRVKDALITALLDGSYQPQPVRGVEIPKPGGGNAWFDQLGLINLTARHAALNAQRNHRGTWPVRPVAGVAAPTISARCRGVSPDDLASSHRLISTAILHCGATRNFHHEQGRKPPIAFAATFRLTAPPISRASG